MIINGNLGSGKIGAALIAGSALAACLGACPVRAADRVVPTASAPVATSWPPAGVSYYGDPARPDISGLWLGTMTGIPGEPPAPNRGPADGRPQTFWAPWPLPYTPAFQKIYDERQAALKQGKALGDISAKCLPFGLPMMLVSKVYPDEIVQTPGQVTFFMNSTFPIVIWTDGRGHPADLKPTYNGHSTGYWLGDTLFVDTVGILPTTPIDSFRNPHGTDLHIKWSIQKLGPDTLHVHVTLLDPGAFTEPATTTNIWQRKTEPRWQILDDSSCFENNEDAKDTTPGEGFIKF